MRKFDERERTILRKVLAYIGHHRVLVIFSLVFAALIVSLSLYLPILQGRAIDQIAAQGQVNFPSLARILLIMAAISAATALLQWIQNVINNRVTFRVVQDLRNDAFEKIQHLPLSYLDAHPSGDLVSRVSTDADQFSEGLLMGFTQLFTGVLTIVGTLAFMLSINWKIALLVVVLTPLSLFAARFIARHSYQYFRSQSIIRGEQTALIDEMIGQQKVVQAYGQEAHVLERFDKVNGQLKESSLKAVFFSSLTNPLTRFVNSLVYACAGIMGAFLCLRNAITVGQLSSVLSYANQYTKPFNEISGVVTELQNAIACAGRLLELIEEPSETPDPQNATEPAAFSGKVDLSHVYFSYVPDRPLIEDFSLHVQPGQKIAIVGPTGCGKTTLINLLMRFYDVSSGDIRVDGISVYQMSRSSLRSGYGMVLQDTWIKEATVRDNIALGKPDATDEEIIQAAKAAHADGFIRRMKDGYQTLLHDNSDLSAGQKQLLCIARIMLCLPPMVILDEATSSIDTRTEARIQESFDRMTEGRTSFVVAHRLSTIRSADVILVMRDGHIVEQGRHEELLRKNGFYAQMYNSQFEHS